MFGITVPKSRKVFGAVAATALAAILGLSLSGAASGAGAAAPNEGSRPLEVVANAVTTNPELLFIPVTPCRIVDTRENGQRFSHLTTRSFYVGGTSGFVPQGGKSGGCGIPTGAKVVSATFSAIDPAADAYGYVRAWAAGSTEPQATLLNYKDQRISIGGQIPLRTGAGTDLTIKNYNGSTDLVIDVNGYYVQQLQAYISSSGTVIDQSGRLVSASKTGTGVYKLDWDRDVSTCSGQASSDISGYIMSVYTSPGATSYVYVYNNAGTPSDYWINVVISC